MFKLYFTIAILGFICFIEYKKYKHILVATVVYPIMWIVSLIGVIIKGKDYYEIGWITVLIIILGYILFILGFSLVLNRKKETLTGDVKTTPDEIGNQLIGLNLIVIISLFITIMVIVLGLKYIDFGNILESLTKIKRMVDKGEKPFPYIVVVSRYFLRCAIWYLSLVFFRIPKGKSYKTKEGYNYKTAVFIRLIMVIGMAMVVMFTDISRNDILMTLLPVLFIYAFARILDNKKIVVLLAVCFTAFLMIFVVFMNFRRGAIEKLFEDENESGKNSIINYLSHGIPALDRLYRTDGIGLITFDGGNGRYTLSLLAAFSDMLFSTQIKPDVLQKDIDIGPREKSVVYTYYQWLGMDFGIIYAVLFNIILGMLYAFLYKRAKMGGFGATFWYAVLSYPLCMMFFEDQFLAIAQTWLIIVVFSYIIFFICNKSYIKIRYINKYRIGSYVCEKSSINK